MMTTGLMTCLIGIAIKLRDWQVTRLLLDWERRISCTSVCADFRTSRPARLKVENLHYDLSEDDLSVALCLCGVDLRLCSVELVLLRVCV